MTTGTRHHVRQGLVGGVTRGVAGDACFDILRVGDTRPVAIAWVAVFTEDIDIAICIGVVNGMHPVGEGDRMGAFAIRWVGIRSPVTGQALIRVKHH